MGYIFLIMILLHIIDDFVLQPICLSKLKQKSFWETYVKDDEKYKFDYKVALVIHALSWSIMIHLPLMAIGKKKIYDRRNNKWRVVEEKTVNSANEKVFPEIVDDVINTTTTTYTTKIYDTKSGQWKVVAKS